MIGRVFREDQAIIDVPAMLIRINKKYRENISAEELLEVTRGIWKISPRREKARYAFAVFKGAIKEVYRINRWLPAGTLEYKYRPDAKDLKCLDRWEFEGSLAEDNIRERFVGKSCVFKKGHQSPIVYVNC